MVNLNCFNQALGLYSRCTSPSFGKSTGVTGGCSNPVYSKNLDCDTFVKSTKSEECSYIPEDASLFSWAEQKPSLDVTDINPESLVMVHRTNYFPKDGKILSTKEASKDENGVCEPRSTVHFALNKSVTEHMAGGNWNSMEYSIILPFKETVESMPDSKIIGGIQDDFFVFDSVKLPKGTVILKHNSEVPKGQFKVSEAFDGIKLIETSTDDMAETTNLVIKKMGYTPYNDAMQEHLGADDEEMGLLTSISECEFKDRFRQTPEKIQETKDLLNESLNIYEDIKLSDKEMYNSLIAPVKQQLKFWDLAEKLGDKMNDVTTGWKDFCDKENYYQGLHNGTSWAKSEGFFTGLDILVKGHKDSWVWDKTDYKNVFLQILKDVKDKLPKDKELGFDIDKLICIVKESKSPESAKEEIAEKLKLKPLSVNREQAMQESEAEMNGDDLEYALQCALALMCN